MTDKIKAYGLLAAMKGGAVPGADSTNVRQQRNEAVSRTTVGPTSPGKGRTSGLSSPAAAPWVVGPSSGGSVVSSESSITFVPHQAPGKGNSTGTLPQVASSPSSSSSRGVSGSTTALPSAADFRSTTVDLLAATVAPPSRPRDHSGGDDEFQDEVEKLDPPAAMSGQYVASIMQLAGNGSNAVADSKLTDAMRAASAIEVAHEIVALGDGQLALNENNWQKFRRECDIDIPTLVVSFLGDTSAGKSHTIRELMSGDADRPFCQPAAAQASATTFNVNMYVCKSLCPGVTLNLMDYEGENGTETPAMAAARSLTTSSSHPRHKAVSEMFPKLAYTTSDVLVVVCREPFFNRRYLERCIALASRANSGVHNVDHPALVLVGNKLPGEECELDVRKATAQFFEAWGAEADALHTYFSAVLCIYVPHKRGMWLDAADNIVNGAEVFASQMDQLRKLLSVIVKSRVGAAASASAPRFLTQRQGLWYALLPLVIRDLNAGRAVNVSSLVDEAWASAMAVTAQSDETDTDIFYSFTTFLKPPRDLSATAPLLNEDILLRFESFRSLVLDVCCRLLACRLRSLEPEVLLDHKVRAYTSKVLRDVMFKLGDLTPCVCAYAGPGTPVEHPDDPVFCLQEFRVHRCHRTSRRVKGGRGFWGKITGIIPYNEVWPGEFDPPRLADIDEAELVETVLRYVHMPPSEFMAQLLTLQMDHSTPRVEIGFCPLSNLPQFQYGDFEESRSNLGDRRLQSDRNVPLDVVAQLRANPRRIPDRNMVYCIGCAHKASVYGAASPSSDAGVDAGEKSWMHERFMNVLSSLGFGSGATSKEIPEGDIPRAPSGRSRFSSTGSHDVDADEVEALEGVVAQRHSLRPRGVASAGSSFAVAKGGAAPVSAMTMVWPALSLLLGGSPASSEPSSPEGPAVQRIWFALCDNCWQYLRL